MRIIEQEQIIEAVAKMCIESNIYPDKDIHEGLVAARLRETSPLAQFALDSILKNADVAKRENLPLCQDTGMAVVFVEIGTEVHVNGNISEAINAGVRKGYKEGFFRNSVVADPLNRINTGDNTPAVIHYDFVPGGELLITVAPKGFGSENMSAVIMLNPSDGISGVEDFAVECVRKAGANPCPPIIVGVGIGGTIEKAALLAKQALLCKRDDSLSQHESMETRLLERINALGIGAAGFGGETTALSVKVLTYPTHIAGLPVAVNIGCHASRHARCRI
ncbi:MAG: fumarate hydratase [Oscillospiraceae bacterium]|nr:fumarate hydratase [Oscillospiraceae bacterium]